MIDDSVAFCFDILSRDTAAAGARLVLRRVPAIAHCAACGGNTPVRPPLTPDCTLCGARALHITGGREFYVDSIEVDE